MKFVCLGYFDESQWDQLTETEQASMMEACLEYDDELRRGGHFVGGEALDSAGKAVTLRIKSGSLDVTDGPYAETKETLGGILFLEARDINHAIALMSKHPGVKVGPFEIRPSSEEINQMVEARHKAIQDQSPLQNEVKCSVQTLRDSLTLAFEWIKPLADDLADAPMTSPTPNDGNHPMWIMGHLVYSSSSLLTMMSKQDNPYADWKLLFEGGTQPQPDADQYPPYSEVLEAYEATHKSVLAAFGEMSESQLGEKPAAVPEVLREDPSFQSNGKLFLFIAMHEMSHRGQLADARRVLERKPFA